MPRVSKKQADEMDVEVRDGAATRSRDARERIAIRIRPFARSRFRVEITRARRATRSARRKTNDRLTPTRAIA
jgi:hypothetical protein